MPPCGYITPVVAYAVVSLKLIMVVGCGRVAGDGVDGCRVGLLMVVGGHVGAAQVEIEGLGAAGLEAVFEVFRSCRAGGGGLAEVEGAVAGVGGWVLMLMLMVMGKVWHGWVGLWESLRRRCGVEVW